MKKLLTIFAMAVMGLNTTFAQDIADNGNIANYKLIKHLDLGLTLGSDGIGLDLSMPVVDKWVNVRAGFTYMPQFDVTMHFGFEAGDASMTQEEKDQKFDRLSDMLYEMIGTRVDKQVDMVGTPKFNNFKFLVDVTPFRNKNWHFTTGFYWGPSRVAYAENAVYDATSLVSASFYNSMYDRVLNSYNNLWSEWEKPYMSLGGQDLYPDDNTYNSFKSYGRMKVQLGEYVDTGKPCYVEPDENNMMICNMKVNSFRPYLGFGYGGRLSKKNDDFRISFDAGVMFWGGTPKVLVNAVDVVEDKGLEPLLDAKGEPMLDDFGNPMMVQVREATVIHNVRQVDLAKDVRNIGGKVGDYVDVMKKFKVYPVINLRISKRLW